MNNESLNLIEINPSNTPKGCVIWLHGLGADGHDFEPLARQWDLTDQHGIRFVFPNAPVQPVTINGGMSMRAWYDIRQPDISAAEDTAGIQASQQYIETLISAEQEKWGIAASQIILAGFSQGGAIALQTGLRYPQCLGGILALSCYLPLPTTLTDEKQAPSEISIRMDHGIDDPVVPVALAEESSRMIERQGYAVAFNRYPMAHSLYPEQIDSLYGWLRRRLTG
ncbi:MAG: alpha/beta hydrolase-fold protein [Gammaproteobacteria bacterium]